MQNEFDGNMRWTGGDLAGKGRYGGLPLTAEYRISDERFQSAVLGGLIRKAARRIGKSLHLELHRGARVA